MDKFKMPEMRMSPDGKHVGIRNAPDRHYRWQISNGGWYSDDQVIDWVPLAPRATSPATGGQV